MAVPKKPRKCRVCKEAFQPSRPLQTCCSPDCALKQAKFKRAKEERMKDLADRKTIKIRLAKITPGYLADKAQAAINAYVRVRDYEEGCISCDKPASWHGQWQAGHLKTRGANSFLRYDLRNINKQCSQCNNHGSGNVAEHERGIIARHGQERLDFLLSAPRLRSYDDDYLIRLAKIFRKKTRILKKRKGL